MFCPSCGAPRRELKVLETSHTTDQTRRRYKCGLCEQRFSTVEIVVKDNRRTSTQDLLVLPEGVKEILKAALTG